MTTIGETVSRVRNLVKGVKEDAFLTDRLIYSLILKYAKLLIRRQDTENKIMRFQSLFQKLPCVELVEVDKIEACCSGIKSNCKIMRTKEKLPTVLEGSYGPLFRAIASVDGSIIFYKTYPSTYTFMANSTTFKYNKNKYYWYLDGYLYFPNIDWEAVRVEAIFEGQADTCTTDDCLIKQDQPLPFPEYLFSEIEQFAVKELTVLLQVPVDTLDDSQNILR